MNIKPLFYYRFKDTLKGALIFFMVLVILVFGFAGMSLDTGTFEATFSGYTFGALVTLFIFGICSIREDLRLGIQHGISRRTAFSAELLSSASIAFILAVSGELLNLAGQLLTTNHRNIHIIDLYQVIYHGYNSVSLSAGQHILSILFGFLLILLANVLGAFLSLLFYRLNKFWTVVVGAGIPILLFVVVPMLGIRLEAPFLIAIVNLIAKIFSSPAGAMISFVVMIAVVALINWLLLRRAPIRSTKG